MKIMKITKTAIAAGVMLVLTFAGSAYAMIDGVEATTFNLTAREGYISTAEGNSLYAWGYADGAGSMQYPGVTMMVRQGDVVAVNLTNALPATSGNVSIVFPGQKVTAVGGVKGLLTQEAPPDGATVVTYTFTATNPGTYLYHSGTNPELQTEMGLVGALIVRPTGYDPMMPMAYETMGSDYTNSNREFLFLLTEIDERIHVLVETQGPDALAQTDYLSNYFPTYWLINGRTATDTMFPAFVPWLPTQPYNCMPMMHPGDKMLMRFIGAGRHMHPFHPHGNHVRFIAIDGRPLSTDPTMGLDLSHEAFTIQSVPGRTYDTIFEWTGKDLGWDIYGHTPGDPMEPNEYEPDHGKPFPTILPDQKDLVFGGMYSGSPFLGTMGTLPPGEGGMNPMAGFAYMWHSHTEKEMTNFDVFPGGMMTMLIIVSPSVNLDDMQM